MAETLPDLLPIFKNYIVIDLQTWSLGIVVIILIKSLKCISLVIVTVNLLWLSMTFSAFLKYGFVGCTVTKPKCIHWHEKHASA